jgi:phosphatidylglycerophosphatase C
VEVHNVVNQGNTQLNFSQNKAIKMTKSIAIFDLDGTLTTKDSMIDFVAFSFGKARLLLGLLWLSPTLTGYVLGFINNSYAKQKVYKYFFENLPLDRMEFLGTSYGKYRLPQIIRPNGLEKLKWHKQKGHDVVICSASAEYWIQSWANAIGVDLIGTKLEVRNGVLTGSYFGKNCHGEEKVRRIKEQYDLDTYPDIYAYGDSTGDQHMLKMANHSHYKPFKS